VELFRDHDAREGQKVEFRALMDLLQAQSFRLRDEGGSIVVNGTPVDGAAVDSLAHRLALHNVGEISMPADPPPVDVFELLRAIADQPGGSDIPTRLRSAGARSITVALGSAPATPAAAAAPGGSLGTEGILRGEPMTDIKSPAEWVAGVPRLTFDPALPAPETALPAQGLGGPADAMAAPPAPPPSAAPPVPAAAPPAASKPSGRTLSAAEQALQDLARDPQGPNVGDVLALLGREAELAVGASRWEQYLAIVVEVVRQEQQVSNESAQRYYRIALRRMLPKATLERLVKLVSVHAHRASAVIALRRSGADGVEILLDLLVRAPDVAERRGAFDALRQMREGTEQLINLLDHEAWFVVRNMAELAGELGMKEAVPALALQLGHSDERVRKSTALALAKIGTVGAAEALRRALRDQSVDVRMQVALGVGGRQAGGLVMALVSALDEEKEETIQRELILALGRIGTPDAVQALIRVSHAPRPLFGRKPTGLRMAAVEALRLAGTAPAIGTLQGLAEQSDRQISAAAKAALEELRKTGKK
jgi:HEAT repeat protein